MDFQPSRHSSEAIAEDVGMGRPEKQAVWSAVGLCENCIAVHSPLAMRSEIQPAVALCAVSGLSCATVGHMILETASKRSGGFDAFPFPLALATVSAQYFLEHWKEKSRCNAPRSQKHFR